MFISVNTPQLSFWDPCQDLQLRPLPEQRGFFTEVHCWIETEWPGRVKITLGSPQNLLLILLWRARLIVPGWPEVFTTATCLLLKGDPWVLTDLRACVQSLPSVAGHRLFTSSLKAGLAQTERRSRDGGGLTYSAELCHHLGAGAEIFLWKRWIEGSLDMSQCNG